MLALLPLLVSTGWVALLFAAPLMPGWAGAVVYGLCAFICHQIPERSFHLAGFQLPVCARCLGIYLGLSGGVAYACLRPITGRATRPAPSREFRRLAVVAAAPTLLTVALEAAGAWHPANGTRALAGLPLGILIGLVVMNALAARGLLRENSLVLVPLETLFASGIGRIIATGLRRKHQHKRAPE